LRLWEAQENNIKYYKFNLYNNNNYKSEAEALGSPGEQQQIERFIIAYVLFIN
jgi:hypothetical protein